MTKPLSDEAAAGDGVTFAFMYAGVSSIVRRIHKPTGPRMPPSRNGMRHPQASICSGVKTVFISAAMPEPSRMPATTLICWKLP